MDGRYRVALAALLALTSACARDQAGNGNATVVAAAPKTPLSVASMASNALKYQGPGRREGAYTWYPVEVDEARAIQARTHGVLSITTPSGESLHFNYQRHVEHATGEWTWIGRLQGGSPSDRIILTFGDHAVVGEISRRGSPPLRLSMRDGSPWLVEIDPRQFALIDNEATHPTREDFLVPPRVEASGPAAAAAPVMSAYPPVTAAGTVVDVVAGYTVGFKDQYKSASACQALGADECERRAQSMARVVVLSMADRTNMAYDNSGLTAQVRIVALVQVAYPDATSNETTLEELSGYRDGKAITTAPAFSALRAAREQYGADLVTLVRRFNTPENGSCGVAWLIGSDLRGFPAGSDAFGYSVVSSGSDTGTDGRSYVCLDQTFAHELGHNMGSAHDRAAATEAGVLHYGAFPYSFGYKAKAGAGAFFTVMAYGDSGQSVYDVFSDPRTLYCEGYPCGVANQADNARSLEATIPLVADFRASVVAPPVFSTRRYALRQLDANADGRSDLVFFDYDLGGQSTWLMSGTQRLSTFSSAWWQNNRLVDAADFDGDGRTDLLFRTGSYGPTDQMSIAFSRGDRFDTQTLPYALNGDSEPVGAADINGNGRADILLRDLRTGKLVVWYMSGTSRTAYSSLAIDPTYELAGTGDFDGDGRVDLLWTSARLDLMIGFNRPTGIVQQHLPLAYQSSYKLAGVQDINGDHRADIVLTSNDGLRLVTWFMNGANRTAYSTATIDPRYRLVGKGDFNGDGRGDLVLSDPATRKLMILTSTGAAFVSKALDIVPTGVVMDVWQVL